MVDDAWTRNHAIAEAVADAIAGQDFGDDECGAIQVFPSRDDAMEIADRLAVSGFKIVRAA